MNQPDLNKKLPILIAGCFLFLLFLMGIFPFSGMAAIDAPHNAANLIDCGSCHDSSIPNSPLLAGSDINAFCIGCHLESDPNNWNNTTAPLVKGHTSVFTNSKYATTSQHGSWDRKCTHCHDPHSQGQKYWKNTNAADLFLARGQIDTFSCDDGGTDCQVKLEAAQDLIEPVTTLTYSGGSFKSGWTAADLGKKTTAQRGAVIMPNLSKTGFTFPVIAMDGSTITVKGYIGIGNVYQYKNPPTGFGIILGQYVRQYVDADNNGTTETAIKYLDHDGDFSFAKSGSANICEVCHTDTGHWGASAPGGDKHFSSLNCTECHKHQDGFGPSWPDHDTVVTTPSFCQTAGCHDSGIFTAHQINASTKANCATCHQINDNLSLTGTLPDVFLKNDVAWNPSKEKDMLTGPARCDNCHHGQFDEHVTDTGHGKIHDKIVLGYDSNNDGTGDQILACDACHYPDAVQEHVTRRSFTCSVCHDRTGLGLPEVAAITNTIAAGMAGTTVFCDDCHNDNHFLTEAGTSLVKEHHNSSYSKTGNCVKCHVVGPGERGPQRPPCWYCHGQGKPGDPQRAGVNKHDQGPAITADSVNDFRACFSCHLNGGPGFVSGVTPAVVPMHGLPGTAPNYSTVYWPYGYYRDGANQWQTPAPLIPTDATPDIPANLENDPARWSTWPGWHVLNYLGDKKNAHSTIYNDYTHPEVQDWARFGTNSIRNRVDISYEKQDYPTVPISMGGSFEIPSFDGTGTLGKPTGSGSISVTISPAAAVTAGARWRLDGGSWRNSGASAAAVTDRTNHRVEFKPLAGWNEPAPVEATVVNLQTTTLSGAAATYTACPDGIQFDISRDGGVTTFDWSSPEQVETFTASGWHGDPVACELWRNNAGTLTEAEGFQARTADSGNGCVIDKDGITPAGQYDLLLRASGSSCFRNNDELEMTVNVTAAGAPSPTGQAGGMITLPSVTPRSRTLPTSTGHDIMHLAGNLYVQLNTSGTISTFTINSDGTVGPVIQTADLWGNGASNGPNTKMVRVHDTLIALTYNMGPQGSAESRVMTVAIEQNGTVITKKQEYQFHTGGYSLRPMIFPDPDDSSLFIVTWVGYTSGATTTGLLTVRINRAGVITELDRDMTLPSKGLNWRGTIVHVAGDTFAFAMAQDIYIIRVDADGMITISQTGGSPYRYAADAYYTDMIRVKDNVFVLTYGRGVNGIDAGVLKTVLISDAGVISRTVNTYMFEPCSAQENRLSLISDAVVGVSFYGGCTGQSGVHLNTFAITDDGRIMVPPLDSMLLSGGGGSPPRMLQADGDISAFLLGGDTSEGASFSGVKTYAISHDSDNDGIADNTDNCPAQSNAGQADDDGDGVGNSCDICAGHDDTLDTDSDGIADSCDVCPGHDDLVDSDSDGTPDGCDPCPSDPTDDNADHDGICIDSGFNAPNAGDQDNCPAVANGPGQAGVPNVGNQTDSDCDGAGDACSTPVYFIPTSTTLSTLTHVRLTVSFNDVMQGEDGYRIEGKLGTCADNTYSMGPLTTIYRYDRFDSGIDPDAWVQGATVQTASSSTPPASATDASGTAEVSWENGQVRLHNIVNDMAQPGAYNSAYIGVKNYAEVIGDKDFDVQVDYALPNGAFFGDTYHADVRLSFYFPQTNGKNNEFYLERRAGHYVGAIMVNGILEVDDLATSDLEGTLRLVRKNRELSAYVLINNSWVLIKKHNQPQTAALTPTWAGIVQYAQRNESGGGELTALVDNFRFNTVGSVPVAALDLPLNEASWQGVTGEVKDATAGNNHGTAYNGAHTVVDTVHGTVGRFDGTDDFIEISGAGSLENITDASFTFAAWAKPMSQPPMTDPNPPANDWRYTIIGRPGWHTDMFYNTDKTFHFEILNSTDNFFEVGSPVYEPGQWHHIVGVVDDNAKKLSLYIDGQLKSSTPYTGTLRDYGTLPYFVGTSNHDTTAYMWFFDGMIDDAKVFDRALGASEITALYNNRIDFVAKALTPGTTYCARVYPFKTDSCPNWPNHKAQAEGTTLTTTAANATTAGTATAVAIKGGNALSVTMPYSTDRNADNTYTVEYKLSAAGSWTTHAAGAAHTATPYAATISGLTLFEKYDVRVTYTDPDGIIGTAQQIIANIVIKPGISCLSILNNGGSAGDGLYWLDPDGDGSGAPFQAYCDMTTDGGGWTLAMKLDGSQSTFQYSANYWTTANTLNPGSPAFDTTQAKLQSFNSVAFTQVRLGMRQYSNPADDIDWITANQAGDSLTSLFNSGYITTYVGRDSWLALLEGVNTQPNCNREGFNAEQTYSKMRIGLAMNAEADCNSCDRILGFGNQTSGHPWGAWAVVGGGYPGSNTVAYGWILVR